MLLLPHKIHEFTSALICVHFGICDMLPTQVYVLGWQHYYYYLCPYGMDEQRIIDFLRCHIAFLDISLSCSNSSVLSVAILNTEN